MGFGLFHIEGAILFIISIFFMVLDSKGSLLKNIALIVALPLGSTVARSAIIPFILLSTFSKEIWLKLMMMVTFSSLLILSIFIENGPLYEALEVFRVLLNNDSMSIRSTSAVANMVIWPDSIYTYLYGDGRFYDDAGGFYMHTDIGYLRILYFSGILGVVLFMLMNIFLLFYPIVKYKKLKKIGKARYSLMAFALLILVIVMNIKGLFLALVFFPVIYLNAKNSLH